MSASIGYGLGRNETHASEQPPCDQVARVPQHDHAAVQVRAYGSTLNSCQPCHCWPGARATGWSMWAASTHSMER